MGNKLMWVAGFAALMSCNGSAMGGNPISVPRLSVTVGMPVADFNSQQETAGFRQGLDATTTSVAAIGKPHLLSLYVNGRSLVFDTGAPNAQTFVQNGYIAGGDIDSGKIRYVSFTLARELMSLDEALRKAAEVCALAQAAGLRPRRDDEGFASITEAVGNMAHAPLHDFAALRSSFIDTALQARSAVLCNLEDERQTFQLSLTNTRRARHFFAGGGDESGVLEEKVYSLGGHLGQNLDTAFAAASVSEATAHRP